jgi:hypothetical protein
MSGSLRQATWFPEQTTDKFVRREQVTEEPAVPSCYRLLTSGHRRRWALPVVLSAALLSTSCGSDSGSSVANVAHRHQACAQHHSDGVGASRGPSVLRGDVDGDGSTDTVAVVHRPTEPLQCQYVLSVSSPEKRWEAPIGQSGTESGGSVPAIWNTLRLPDVNALVRLPGHQDLLVGVTTWTGASTVFAGIFGIVDGELSRISIPAAPMPDALSYGGSVVNASAVDCRGHRVLFSTGNEDKGKWQISQQKYELAGGALVGGTSPQVSLHKRLTPEFGAAGGEDAFFRTCAVARSARSF